MAHGEQEHRSGRRTGRRGQRARDGTHLRHGGIQMRCENGGDGNRGLRIGLFGLQCVEGQPHRMLRPVGGGGRARLAALGPGSTPRRGSRARTNAHAPRQGVNVKKPGGARCAAVAALAKLTKGQDDEHGRAKGGGGGGRRTGNTPSKTNGEQAPHTTKRACATASMTTQTPSAISASGSMMALGAGARPARNACSIRLAASEMACGGVVGRAMTRELGGRQARRWARRARGRRTFDFATMASCAPLKVCLLRAPWRSFSSSESDTWNPRELVSGEQERAPRAGRRGGGAGARGTRTIFSVLRTSVQSRAGSSCGSGLGEGVGPKSNQQREQRERASFRWRLWRDGVALSGQCWVRRDAVRLRVKRRREERRGSEKRRIDGRNTFWSPPSSALSSAYTLRGRQSLTQAALYAGE